jgi:hypothetical protein
MAFLIKSHCNEMSIVMTHINQPLVMEPLRHLCVSLFYIVVNDQHKVYSVIFNNISLL